MVGRNPVRLREVVFTLSRDEVNVMSGLFKDIPHKAAHWVQKVRAPDPGSVASPLRSRIGECGGEGLAG